MAPPKRHLDPKTAREWSDMAHVCFVDALTSAAPMRASQIAFHGGTNLHLSWRSPRFSEDLDFIIEENFASRMGGIIEKAGKRLSELVSARDPSLNVEIRDKSKPGSKLLVYRIVITEPSVIGQAMVKAEFWQASADYMSGYDTRIIFAAKDVDVLSRVSQPIPAASLTAAYADKLTAFATRPFLKWRDIFDLWWIARQQPMDPVEVTPKFLHHLSAYNTPDGMTPGAALRRFLDRDPKEVFSMAEPELKRWLPDALWDALNPDGVWQMIDHARETVTKVADESDRLLDARARQEGPDASYPGT